MAPTATRYAFAAYRRRSIELHSCALRGRYIAAGKLGGAAARRGASSLAAPRSRSDSNRPCRAHHRPPPNRPSRQATFACLSAFRCYAADRAALLFCFQAAEEQRQLEAILASSLNEIEMTQLAQRKEEATPAPHPPNTMWHMPFVFTGTSFCIRTTQTPVAAIRFH